MTDTMRAARARLLRPLPRAPRRRMAALLDAIRNGAGPAPTHAMTPEGRVFTLAEYRSPEAL